MASSWWEFGEHSGYQGSDLALHRITCAFCYEKGNFEMVHHTGRKNTSGKVLNYDIFKCTDCGNLTMVFWSAIHNWGPAGGLHDYAALPWPQETTTFPEFWPADVGRYWLQARRSLETNNWDAAALMARSAVQLVVREQKAKKRSLKNEIDDLASRGLLPPIMKEWAHAIRVLGNENAHPTPGDPGTTQKDANDVVEFLSFLLRMLYTLPHEIKQFRGRKKP